MIMGNTKEITAKKTHYCVEGFDEPCFEVSNGFVTIRIAPYYHYIGANTLMVTEYIDGDYNSSEELRGDFQSLTEADAIRIAKEYSAYL